MDDADLEKLVCTPGKLTPRFNRDTKEYQIILNSGVKEFKIDPLTRDSNASWTILSIGTKRTIAISEGTTNVLSIEVTAEDGTVKKYNIKVISLSSNSATLSTLAVKGYTLKPNFNEDNYEYECDVPSYISTVQIESASLDKNTKIEFNNHDNDSIELNVGLTNLDVLVTSPNGEVTKVYNIRIQKQRLIFPLHLPGFVCKICHCVVHRPVSVANDLSVIFCHACLQTLTRTNKVDPSSGEPLVGGFIIIRNDIEEQMSNTSLECPLKCGKKILTKQLGAHVKENCEHKFHYCEKTDIVFFEEYDGDNPKLFTESCRTCSRVLPSCDLEFHQERLCNETFTFKHQIKQHSWQRKYEQRIISQDYPNPLSSALECEEEYLRSIERKEYEAAFLSLEKACQLYSFAISLQPKNADSHFRLAIVLEEMHFITDIYNISMENTQTDMNENDEFQTDESMEDDIKALAYQRGFGENASKANQLKALDQEYHFLLDQGQSEKADYLQKLYEFKQKKIHGKKSNSNSSETYLSKAFIKYLDAASIANNNAVHQLHAGKCYLQQSRYREAVKRFENALLLKPAYTEAKFYLGIAMMHTDESLKELSTRFIQDGFVYFLHQFQNYSKESRKMIAEMLSSPYNLLMLRELLNFAKQKQCNLVETCFFKNKECFNSILLICFNGITDMAKRGEIFTNLLCIIYKTLYEHGLELSKKSSDAKMIDYWQCVLSLTSMLGDQKSQDILDIQLKICEASIILRPCSSKVLNHLGEVMYALLDISPSQVCIGDIEKCFRASIELEGKSISEREPINYLSDTEFWKKCKETLDKSSIVSTEKDVNKQTTNQKRVEKRQGLSSTLPKTTTIATRKVKALVSGTSVKSSVKTNSSIKEKLTLNESTVQNFRQTVPIKPNGGIKPSSKPSIKKCSSKSKESLLPTSSPIKLNPTIGNTDVSNTKRGTEEGSRCSVLELNQKSHIPRIGLARILAKRDITQNFAEVIRLYKDVISMAPKLHDPYIELGELLNETAPLEAVDVYVNFPFSTDLSYDDAYLCGEVVRILMKTEHYDDLRLEKFLIALGKIFGFTSLDKYTAILENKLKYNQLLCRVYAGVNNKSIDHPDLQAFFKFKYWI